MTDFVGHLVLFGGGSAVLLMLPLIAGRLLRPRLPTPEKDSIYECGEPAIGSSYIQFDLRFYVVALLFIIFDVEVAFFFPWAAVYGSAMQLADSRLDDGVRQELSNRLLNEPAGSTNVISSDAAIQLGLTGFVDILIFFVVLLVGFAYVWKRGDLDWIRALTKKSHQASDQTSPALSRATPVSTSV